jgi:hypothetical protein
MLELPPRFGQCLPLLGIAHFSDEGARGAKKVARRPPASKARCLDMVQILCIIVTREVFSSHRECSRRWVTVLFAKFFILQHLAFHLVCGISE